MEPRKLKTEGGNIVLDDAWVHVQKKVGFFPPSPLHVCVVVYGASPLYETTRARTDKYFL